MGDGMGKIDAHYLRGLVRSLSAGERVPTSLRNQCHRLMMAIDKNHFPLIEECIVRIRQLAREEGYPLPADEPNARDNSTEALTENS